MMKNILLATDFSQNAHMAAIHAAGLARHTAARLIIFHVLDPASKGENQAVESYSETEVEVQDKLDALSAELYKLFGISITRLLKPGVALHEIIGLAEKTGADLLITGVRCTKLQGNKKTDGVTNDLLMKSKVPLVCIQPGALVSLPDELQMILQEKQESCNPAGLQLVRQILEKLSSDKPVID